MLEKLLEPVINGIIKAGSATLSHLSKNWRKYLLGVGTVAAVGAAYEIGKSKGHKEGKIEGTIEQSQRDEKKMKEMHKKHESDYKRWNEEKQEYEDLLNNINN